MLFRGKDSGLDKCEICNASRYKDTEKKTAAKRMRYFPLKPRLQKLFMSSKTATLMRWHSEERIDDGKFRHPADALAWKDFDLKNPSFASDPRNIRMGLAADGFNLFRTLSVTHSTWPVILIPYNLPPWLCMKQPNFILSTLIDGPKSPGNKIDVYLQPLVEELNELWNGVMTYDVSSTQMFNMRAALLWTISDFPGYAMLSGWGTKGAYACPNCGKDTRSKWLDNGHKYCYTCHRRFLPRGHKLRRDKVSFDGTIEMEIKKASTTVTDIISELDSVATEYKKEDLRKRRRAEYEKESEEHIWKKKSIFFELPYWSDNLIRHNLDVMHIEKNKSNIRLPLHPVEKGSGKYYLPPAPFTLGKRDKETFCKVLKSVKAPDGYLLTLKRYVRNRAYPEGSIARGKSLEKDYQNGPNLSKLKSSNLFVNGLGEDPHGRVRCMGRGITRHKLCEISSHNAPTPQMVEQLQELQRLKDDLIHEKKEVELMRLELDNRKEEFFKEKEQIVDQVGNELIGMPEPQSSTKESAPPQPKSRKSLNFPMPPEQVVAINADNRRNDNDYNCSPVQ
ncbi:UNVERIFIED_CONTAM: hypothetical protein Sradi_6944600, partial [Sesamum radiatum]